MCLAAPSGWELPSVLCGPAGLGLAPGGPSSPAEAACCALSWVQELCCPRGPQVALSSQRRLSDGDTPVYPVFTQEASGPGRLDNSPKVTQGTEEAEPSWSAVADPPTSWRAPRAGQGVFSVALGAWPGARWMVSRLWAGLFLGPWTPFLQHAGSPSDSQRPELTPASPLKAVCPWLAAASTLEVGGRLSPLTQGFPWGAARWHSANSRGPR